MRKSKYLHFLFFIISPILFEVQRCTISHFKALDKLFRPLAWVLTVGAITFVMLSKISVLLFYPYFTCGTENSNFPLMEFLQCQQILMTGQKWKKAHHLDTLNAYKNRREINHISTKTKTKGNFRMYANTKR